VFGWIIVPIALFIVYFVFRKKNYRVSVYLWWATLITLIANEILVGIDSHWGYWRGYEAQLNGGLGEPGEAGLSYLFMVMFWLPTLIQIVMLITLLIKRPVKAIENKPQPVQENG